MNLPEAIKILIILTEPESILDTEKLHTAIQLGIESMKRIEHGRLLRNRHCLRKLPGETKE